MDTMAACGDYNWQEHERVRRPHPPDRPYPIVGKSVPRANDEIVTNHLVQTRLLRFPKRNTTESTDTVRALHQMDQVVILSKNIYQKISGQTYLPSVYKESYYSNEDELKSNILRVKDILSSCLDEINRLILAHKTGISDAYNVAKDAIPSLHEWMDTMKTRSDMRERHNLNLILDLKDQTREVVEYKTRIQSFEDKLKNLEFEGSTLVEDKRELLQDNPCLGASETYHADRCHRNELSITNLYERCVELEEENAVLKNSAQKLKPNLGNNSRSSTPFPHTSRFQKAETNAYRDLKVQYYKFLIETETLEKKVATLKNALPCQYTPDQEGETFKKLEQSNCQLGNLQLKERLQALERTNYCLIEKGRQDKNLIDQLMTEKKDLENRLKEVQELLEQQEQLLVWQGADMDTCDILSKRLDNARNENTNLRNKLEEERAKSVRLGQEKEELHNRLKETKELLKQQEQMLDWQTANKETCDTQSKSLAHAKNENKRLSENLKEASDKSGQLGKEVDRLRHRLDESNGKSHRLETLLNDSNDKIRRLAQTNDDLVARLKENQESLKQQEQMLDRQTVDKDTCDTLSERLDNTRYENTNLRKKLEEERAKSVQLGQEIDKLHNRLDDAESEKKRLIEKLKGANLTSVHIGKEEEGLQNRLDDAKRKNERLNEKLKKSVAMSDDLGREVERLRNRLHQNSTAQMMHDKPNFADLSDANRPTKIAERFLELYDNQWDDALNKFKTTYSFDEDKAISGLLFMLMQAYEFCLEYFAEQEQTIWDALAGKLHSTSTVTSHLSSSTGFPADSKENLRERKIIRDLIKRATESSSKTVQTEFLKQCRRLHLLDVEDMTMRSYAICCAQLCWYMVLQSPQVYIESTFQQEDSFDTNKYTYYKTMGNKYKYIVWPVMYLHKNGPVLNKGVAEAEVTSA